MNMSVLHLSSIPIFIVECQEDIINKSNLSLLLDTEFNKIQKDGHLELSKNVNILNHEKLSSLRKIINDNSKIYTEQVLGITNNFKMTHSWITKNVKNSKHHLHKHRGIMFSSVTYFYEDISNDEISPIIFYTPGLKNTFKEMMFNFNIKEYNQINSTCWKVYPKKNQIIFFPAYLDHETEVNHSDKTRYCLATNYLIHGDILTHDIYHNYSLNVN
jgi:hypothetical protein